MVCVQDRYSRFRHRGPNAKSAWLLNADDVLVLHAPGALSCPPPPPRPPALALPPPLQGLVYKLTDYGVPEGKILGLKYGFR